MATDDRDRARSAVSDRIAQLGLTRAEVARRAGVALNTLRDFLDGRKWPMDRTAEAIERALEWPVSSIADIAEGADVPAIPRMDDPVRRSSAGGPAVPSVGQAHEADQVVVVLGSGWSEGLSDLDREEIEANIKAYALRLARELRDTRARREPAQP